MAVTPMGGYTRFAGTMELSGINTKVRQERVRALCAVGNNSCGIGQGDPIAHYGQWIASDDSGWDADHRHDCRTYTT